eukprot:CAMPEP_0178999082 /NCGR_PEP_ID=MMETSP0795-20121207/9858_1 /TAXON_ID=88552 /ORGANISM="Amoebophrya sp., Strain Ameob2" /LENGTH=753 /DNA_ID=CAMNT_0020691807 /DNA_START=439 /DNA_END=2700 /DNA_ORIENTATION=+
MSAPVQKLSTPVDQVNHHFASPINRKHPNVSPLIPGAPVKFKNIGGGPTPVGAGGTASSSSSTNVGGLLSKNDTPEEQHHHDFSDERAPASIPTSVTKTDSTTSPSSSGEQHVSRSSVDGPDLSGNSSSVLKDKEMSTSSPRLSPRGEEGEAAGETAAAAPRPAEENARAPSSDIQKPPPPSDGAAREKSDALRGVLRPPPPKTKKASPPAEPQRFTGISPWKYENASWIKEKLANKYFEAAAEAEALAYERQKLASASMDSPGLRSVASGGGYGSMSEDVVMGMGGMSLASGHGSPPVARANREWNDHPLGVSGYGGNGKGSYGGSSSSSAMGGYGAHAMGAAASHGGNLLYNQLRSAGGVGNGAAAGTTSSTYLQQLLANTSTAPHLAPLGDASLNADDTSWLDEILNPSPVNDISDFLGLGIAAGTAVNGPTQQPPTLTLPNPMQLLSPASAARMMPPPPPPIGMETTSAVPGGTPLMGATTFPPPSFPLPQLASESAISPIPSIPGFGNAATDSVASALGLLDVVGNMGVGNTSVDVDLEAWVNDVVSNSPNVAPSMPPASGGSDPSFENMLVEAVLGDFFEQDKANAANVGTSGLNVADLLNSNNNTTAASDADNFNDLNTLVQNLPEHAKQDMRIRAKQSPFIRNKLVNAQPKVVLDKSTYESADSSIKTPVPVPTRTPGNGPLTSRAKPGRPTFLNLPGDTGEFDRTSSSDGVDSRIPAEARASSKRKAVSPTGVFEVPPLKKVHS